MDRKKFIKGSAILGGVALITPELLLSREQSEIKSDNEQLKTKKMQFINFGPVHLSVTDLEKSIHFWLDIVGMKVRKSGTPTEVGNPERTLVFLHPDAKTPKKKGYSGLYHVAIHLSTETELAQSLVRLRSKGWKIL